MYIVRDSDVRSLGPAFRVNGDLLVERCDYLSTIPTGSALNGSVTVRDCADFAFLPSRLRVTGDLTVENCPQMFTMGSGTQVAGALRVSGCPKLAFTPSALRVNGDVVLNGVSLIEHDTVIGGSLTARRVKHLSPGTSIGGHADFRGSGLVGLPRDLALGAGLDLSWTKIAFLPDGFKVNGDLVLEGCTAIETLPRDLQVSGDLVLDKCFSLTRVSSGVMVGGNVVLGDDLSTHLVSGVLVGGSVI